MNTNASGTLVRSLVCLCAVSLVVAGCDGESGGSDAPAPGSDNVIAWSPSGTFPVPTYQGGCRLEAGEVFAMASDGPNNDVLTVSEGANGGVILSLEVTHGEDQILSVADVSLRRGKSGESFRDATAAGVGAAQWGVGLAGEGAVVDGTLCFSDKLTSGGSLGAMFSLIFQDAAGQHHTVGGTFTVPSGDIVDGHIPTVGLAVDLR